MGVVPIPAAATAVVAVVTAVAVVVSTRFADEGTLAGCTKGVVEGIPGISSLGFVPHYSQESAAATRTQ